DVRTGRIPNSLTVPLLATGLIWSTWTGGLSGLATSAGVCILLGLPYVLMFLFAHGGAGDAKLMGAIGAWLGLTQAIIVLLCVASAGIVLSIVKAKTKKQLKIVLASVFVSVYNFLLSLIIFKKMRPKINLTDDNRSEDLDVPYGIAIFAGVCVGAGIVGLWGDKWLW
ncbi:MAG: A24 family peptidase, partial [Planctomycetota bacterium]